MARWNPKNREVRMENAPYWYNTPYKDLDWGWSTEETLELERYCEKILKNCQEEDMTPKDRWWAHMLAKPGEKNADRKLVNNCTVVVYATRTLDGYADALKPIDLYHHPKLFVKAKMATVARYKMDYASWANITYTEGLWGSRGKMIDYGNPSMIGDPPIKTMEDVENVEVPDPYEDGLYPGFLWSLHEMRRLHDKYKLPLPIWTSMCPGPTEVVQQGMMGWTPFQIALRRNPDLAKAATRKANIWCKRFGRSLIKEGNPDGLYCCQFTGGFPLKGANEWVADEWLDLGKDLHAYALEANKRPVHLSHGNSYLTGIMEWYEVLWNHGAFRPGVEAWDGGTGGRGEGPLDKALEWHREHNIYIGISTENTVLEKGTPAEIDAAVKALCDWGRAHRKYSPTIVPVYFVPPPCVDAGAAALKKYSKL